MEGQDIMRTGTSAPVVSILVLGAGILCAVGGIAGAIFSFRRGLAPSMIVTGILLPFLAAGFFLWRWHIGRREMGPVIFDRTNRTVTHEPSQRRWRFEDVRGIRAVRDVTDGTRLDIFPELPKWLLVEFEDGSSLRVAKGSQAELEPITHWLQQAGVSAR